MGREEYALSIDQVREIVVTPNITRIPLAPDYIQGVGNIRGEIISIINLEKKLNIELRTDYKYTVVIESDQYKVGFLVSEVPRTLNIKPNELDTSPTLINNNNDYIRGIVKQGSRMIVLIDIFKIL